VALVISAGFALGVGLNESRNNPTTVRFRFSNTTREIRASRQSETGSLAHGLGWGLLGRSDTLLTLSLGCVRPACLPACGVQSEEVWTAHIKEVEREKRRMAREAAAAAAAANSADSANHSHSR